MTLFHPWEMTQHLGMARSMLLGLVECAGAQKSEDVRVGKDSEIVRLNREAPAELRVNAAEWLAGQRIP